MKNKSTNLRAGFATIDWTPEPGMPLLGQMYRRFGEFARDPLQACAAAFENDGTTAVLVAVDISLLSRDFIAAVQHQFHQQSGLPPQALLIHATHTHVAPTVVSTLMEIADPSFVAHLQDSILEAAQSALERLEPVEVFAGQGTLEYMGWNRRAMLEDGSSQMYGHSEYPGFVGMEGPRDPALPVLWTRNAEGEITGVIVNFSTHPNCLENESFYSADIPGAARKHIKHILGEKTSVVYLTGAAGNTAPSVLDPLDKAQPWRNEVGVERSGLYLAGEAAKVIAAGLEPMEISSVQLHHSMEEIPLRAWPQLGEPSRASHHLHYYDEAEKDWTNFLAAESPRMVNISVLRIGDVAFCTNPAELFVEFGLQIRETSPARITFISQLTDGYVGYVPTPLAFSRGGYETWCAPSSCLYPDAGDRIVATTQKLLHAAFPKPDSSTG